MEVSKRPDGESKVHLIFFPNRDLVLTDVQWQRIEVLLPEGGFVSATPRQFPPFSPRNTERGSLVPANRCTMGTPAKPSLSSLKYLR